MGVWRGMSVSAKMLLIYCNSARREGGILYVTGQLCTFFALWLRAKLISLSSVVTQWVVFCCFFDKCTEAFGGADKEGSILT